MDPDTDPVDHPAGESEQPAMELAYDGTGIAEVRPAGSDTPKRPGGECGAYYGTGDGAATCRRPSGHPPVSEDGIGHAPNPTTADRRPAAPSASPRTPEGDAPDPSWPTCANCECPIQPGETHRANRRWSDELPGSCWIDDLPAAASRTPGDDGRRELDELRRRGDDAFIAQLHHLADTWAANGKRALGLTPTAQCAEQLRAALAAGPSTPQPPSDDRHVALDDHEAETAMGAALTIALGLGVAWQQAPPLLVETLNEAGIVLCRERGSSTTGGDGT